jgi:hypothetical protein
VLAEAQFAPTRDARTCITRARATDRGLPRPSQLALQLARPRRRPLTAGARDRAELTRLIEFA